MDSTQKRMIPKNGTAILLAVFLLLFSAPSAYATEPLDDMELLTRLVWLEARGEDDAGQQAVVQVVLNRLESGRWGDTLYDVVFAPGQFTPASSIPKVKPTEKEYRNVQAVFDETEPCLPPWVMYFARGKHRWVGYVEFVRIGNHQFGGFMADQRAYEAELALLAISDELVTKGLFPAPVLE